MYIIIVTFLLILGVISVIATLRSEKIEFNKSPLLILRSLVIGYIANFFDTLGIGSFITATSMFNLTKYLQSSKLLPGTLNVMNALPTIVEALFFTRIVKVESLTLCSMITASMLGSFIGSKVVTKLDTQKVKLVMGIAMFITSTLMILRKIGFVDFLSQGNTALGLTGAKLVIAVIGNFIFGALMSAGVGIYAPCMVMVYLLGMKPIAAFPIMMTSSAALIPVNVVTFTKEKMFQNRDIWLLIVGGIFGVLTAALFVKNLSMDILAWIVVLIGFYTAFSLLRAFIIEKKQINN